MVMNKFEQYAHYHDLPLRVALGLVFITAGFGKLFGTPGVGGFSDMLSGIGFPAATFLAILVGLVEFAGAIALFFGIWTRYVAAALAVVLLVAIFTVKAATGWGMELFLDIGLLGAAISLMFSGSNVWCMDKKNK